MLYFTGKAKHFDALMRHIKNISTKPCNCHRFSLPFLNTKYVTTLPLKVSKDSDTKMLNGRVIKARIRFDYFISMKKVSSQR